MAYTSKERTILGPLTTVFTPPGPCTVAVGLCTTCDVAWWGQTCAPTAVEDNPSCWPTTTEGAPAPSQAMYGWGFYSPGLECPAGYTRACSAIAGSSSGWKVQYLMEAEETFVGCCPTGFRCDNLKGQTCLMRAKSTTLPTVSCQDGSSNNFGFTTLPSGKVSVLNLYAPMIQLAWKSTDRPDSFTTSATSAPTSSLATSTSTPSDTPSNEPNSSPSTTPGPPLSNGAVAGIAVGAAVLFLLIMVAAIFVWRRRRGGTRGGSGAGHDTLPGAEQTSTADAKFYYTSNVSEMGEGHDRAEAPGDGYRPAEVSAAGGLDRAEMAAGQQGEHTLAVGLPPQDKWAGYYRGDSPAQASVEMSAERYTD